MPVKYLTYQHDEQTIALGLQARGITPTSDDGETRYIWPDGTECWEDELEEMLTFMSDDYETTTT